MPAPEPTRLTADAIDTSVAFRGRAGFNGVAPPASLNTYTQTFSTASRTVAAATATNPPAGGTGATAGAYDTAANRDAMITSLTAVIADVATLRQLINGLIDDLQAAGIVG